MHTGQKQTSKAPHETKQFEDGLFVFPCMGSLLHTAVERGGRIHSISQMQGQHNHDSVTLIVWLLCESCMAAHRSPTKKLLPAGFQQLHHLHDLKTCMQIQ